MFFAALAAISYGLSFAAFLKKLVIIKDIANQTQDRDKRLIIDEKTGLCRLGYAQKAI